MLSPRHYWPARVLVWSDFEQRLFVQTMCVGTHPTHAETLRRNPQQRWWVGARGSACKVCHMWQGCATFTAACAHARSSFSFAMCWCSSELRSGTAVLLAVVHFWATCAPLSITTSIAHNRTHTSDRQGLEIRQTLANLEQLALPSTWSNGSLGWQWKRLVA